MSTAFQRGLVLYQQDRHDLAAREFRQALSQEPDDATAHGFLALCLHGSDKHDEALGEAEEAVRLEPDAAFTHYTKAVALFGLKRYREAQEAALESSRLDPYDPNALGILANIAIARQRWPEALDAASRGLAIDPTHAACRNLRALALVQLGRKDEAAASLGSALADDPENALTHANQGWAYLHQSNPTKALEHFREALRLDPELEWARVGIVEALKARHLFYRLMLRFFLWMGRQSRFVQIALILGLVFGQNALAQVGRSFPALKPFTLPALFLLLAFGLMSWIASPLFNLILRFNRFGRMALSREQTVESTWVGGSFLLALAGLISLLVYPNDLSLMTLITFGALVFPLAVVFQVAPGPPRWAMIAVTAALALLGVPLWGYWLLGDASPLGGEKQAILYTSYMIRGSFFSTWVPVVIGLRPR